MCFYLTIKQRSEMHSNHVTIASTWVLHSPLLMLVLFDQFFVGAGYPYFFPTISLLFLALCAPLCTQIFGSMSSYVAQNLISMVPPINIIIKLYGKSGNFLSPQHAVIISSSQMSAFKIISPLKILFHHGFYHVHAPHHYAIVMSF